jgi:hypothetical protein
MQVFSLGTSSLLPVSNQVFYLSWHTFPEGLAGYYDLLGVLQNTISSESLEKEPRHQY